MPSGMLSNFAISLSSNRFSVVKHDPSPRSIERLRADIFAQISKEHSRDPFRQPDRSPGGKTQIAVPEGELGLISQCQQFRGGLVGQVTTRQRRHGCEISVHLLGKKCGRGHRTGWLG